MDPVLLRRGKARSFSLIAKWDESPVLSVVGQPLAAQIHSALVMLLLLDIQVLLICPGAVAVNTTAFPVTDGRAMLSV